MVLVLVLVVQNVRMRWIGRMGRERPKIVGRMMHARSGGSGGGGKEHVGGRVMERRRVRGRRRKRAVLGGGPVGGVGVGGHGELTVALAWAGTLRIHRLSREFAMGVERFVLASWIQTLAPALVAGLEHLDGHVNPLRRSKVSIHGGGVEEIEDAVEVVVGFHGRRRHDGGNVRAGRRSVVMARQQADDDLGHVEKVKVRRHPQIFHAQGEKGIKDGVDRGHGQAQEIGMVASGQ